MFGNHEFGGDGEEQRRIVFYRNEARVPAAPQTNFPHQRLPGSAATCTATSKEALSQGNSSSSGSAFPGGVYSPLYPVKSSPPSSQPSLQSSSQPSFQPPVQASTQSSGFVSPWKILAEDEPQHATWQTALPVNRDVADSPDSYASRASEEALQGYPPFSAYGISLSHRSGDDPASAMLLQTVPPVSQEFENIRDKDNLSATTSSAVLTSLSTSPRTSQLDPVKLFLDRMLFPGYHGNMAAMKATSPYGLGHEGGGGSYLGQSPAPASVNTTRAVLLTSYNNTAGAGQGSATPTGHASSWPIMQKSGMDGYSPAPSHASFAYAISAPALGFPLARPEAYGQMMPTMSETFGSSHHHMVPSQEHRMGWNNFNAPSMQQNLHRPLPGNGEELYAQYQETCNKCSSAMTFRADDRTGHYFCPACGNFRSCAGGLTLPMNKNQKRMSTNRRSGMMCNNCQTTRTTLWRRDKNGDPVCNACGLYTKLHGINRPISMKKDCIQTRKRNPKSQSSRSKSARKNEGSDVNTSPSTVSGDNDAGSRNNNSNSNNSNSNNNNNNSNSNCNSNSNSNSNNNSSNNSNSNNNSEDPRSATLDATFTSSAGAVGDQHLLQGPGRSPQSTAPLGHDRLLGPSPPKAVRVDPDCEVAAHVTPAYRTPNGEVYGLESLPGPGQN